MNSLEVVLDLTEFLQYTIIQQVASRWLGPAEYLSISLREVEGCQSRIRSGQEQSVSTMDRGGHGTPLGSRLQTSRANLAVENFSEGTDVAVL